MIAEISEDFRAGNTVLPGKSPTKKRKISEISKLPDSKGNDATGDDKTKKKSPIVAFQWVLTWNNYPSNWQDFFLERKGLLEKLCIGEETCPTTGTPHLQGWLKFYKKNNAKTYLNLPKQIHWATMSRNATERQNTVYCTKQRTNILSWGVPTVWSRSIQNMKPWMEELLEILKQPLEEGEAFRVIHWLWEPEGNTGKTVFQQAVYHMFEGVVAIEGKAADVKHFVSDYTKKMGTTPKIIFLNVPRCDQEFVSYGAIEKVKDMFFMSGKYEGGMVSGPRPHVMIFANDGPCRSKMSDDRWKIGRIHDDKIIWQ